LFIFYIINELKENRDKTQKSKVANKSTLLFCVLITFSVPLSLNL